MATPPGVMTLSMNSTWARCPRSSNMRFPEPHTTSSPSVRSVTSVIPEDNSPVSSLGVLLSETVNRREDHVLRNTVHSRDSGLGFFDIRPRCGENLLGVKLSQRRSRQNSHALALRQSPGTSGRGRRRDSGLTEADHAGAEDRHEGSNESRVHPASYDVGCSSRTNSVDAMERCRNRRQRVEQLASGWNQRSGVAVEPVSKPDDPLVAASAEPRRSARTRLTAEEVNAMRTAHTQGVSVTALAKQFGVHRGTIWAKTRESR